MRIAAHLIRNSSNSILIFCSCSSRSPLFVSVLESVNLKKTGSTRRWRGWYNRTVVLPGSKGGKSLHPNLNALKISPRHRAQSGTRLLAAADSELSGRGIYLTRQFADKAEGTHSFDLAFFACNNANAIERCDSRWNALRLPVRGNSAYNTGYFYTHRLQCSHYLGQICCKYLK